MGAPLGNQNAVKAKRWQQAIDRVLERRSKAKGIEELERLAEKFLDEVEAGNNAAVPGYSALGDRLDGKPAQQLIHAGDEDAPLKIIHESK